MTAPAGGEVRSRGLVIVGIALAAVTLLALVVAAVWATFIID
jgi:hypothetical protein